MRHQTASKRSRLRYTVGAFAALAVFVLFTEFCVVVVASGRFPIMRAFAIEITTISLFTAVILPLLLERTPGFLQMVKPIGARRTIYATIAVIFIYPATRIAVVAFG